MRFGIVVDEDPQEHRVPLAPYGVEELVEHGHEVTVESSVGERAQFSDKDYELCGAQVVFSKEEAWIRPDVVLRVRPLSAAEVGLMREGQIFSGYIELPFIPRPTRQAYADGGISILALEEMVDDDGRWPLLSPLSIICGRMLPQIAARYLETFEGGRGKLIMGAPGVAPCNVSIVGGGMLGTTACHMFQAMGARVTVLDHNHAKLELLERTATGNLTTLSASPGNISRICRGSDVIVLAIHSPTGVCDKVLSQEHLKTMAPRAVIIDASITQGGAAETSRPTDVLNPTYIVDDIVHYCVTRITSTVARTASRTVSSALVPYLLSFAEYTMEQAIEQHKEFGSGMICIDGKMRRKYDYLSVEE